MALSFEDYLKNASTETSDIAEPIVDAEEGISLLSETSEEEWVRSDKYTWYEEYKDDVDCSVIDSKKNVSVNKDQINLTQEKNSQIISFIMPRYSDGIDIANSATLNFHIVNAKNKDYMLPAVNVSYSTTQIKFHFLVNEYATSEKGTLKFEIIATGTTSAGEYIWRTRPNSEMSILESLSGNGTIEPGDGWDSYIDIITKKVTEAQTAASQAIEAANEATNIVNSAKNELQSSLNQAISDSLSNYYTKNEVDALLANIDLSKVYEKIDNIDGLAAFSTSYDSDSRVLSFYNGSTVICSETLNSNPTSEWVSAYDSKVEQKINESLTSVNENIDTINSDLEKIHKDIDGLPQTLTTEYYNKDATDKLLDDKADKNTLSSQNEKITSIEVTANTNKSNISTLGNKISDLETAINGIDTSPTLTYDVDYNDEQTFTFYEIEKEGTDQEVKTPKKVFKIQGGSGGGGTATSSTLKIEYVTKSPLVVTTSDKAVIKFRFSGTDSSGDEITEGTATWKLGSTVIATSTVVSGENSFDLSDYISIGSQKILLSITDDAGSLVTKNWTVQKIDVRLESTFDDSLAYPLGTVLFDYTPYGAISKTIHFILDGNELSSVTTTASGIPMAYTLPSQEHGSHYVETYMTAEVNGSIIESNHIEKDILWYDSSSDVPVIGCSSQEITVMQYDTSNIVYTVYDPKTDSPKVSLAVDGEIVSNLTLDGNTQTWQYKSSDVGTHLLTITCRDTVKTIKVTVEKLDINLEPVTAGLEFDFNPTGRSNNDDGRLWSDGNVSMSVSSNFDWINGGYQIDDDGDQYFCVKAGTTAQIKYKLFEDEAKRNGKEFKLVFKTANVRKSDATFLQCLDGADNAQIGLQMDVHMAYIKAKSGSLELRYSEEDIIEFEFNINKNTDIPMVMGYEDGVALRPMIYNDSHTFTQDNPQYITIGCDDCDVYIYRLKVYSTSLTDRGILNNFIADARNAEEMISRYNRNQIYDENNLLTPESLAKACPDIKVIKIECPHFTNDKKDFVKYTNVECIHTGGDPVLDNWVAKNCYHTGQGTTSNEYGASGRNTEILMCFDGTYKNSKITYDEDYKTILTLGDGTKYEDGTGKISLTRSSVPTNYLNIKVNIASSENENNAILQKRYNTYLPYQSVAMKNDSRVKNSMEFVNCVVFIKESDTDVSTHREFDDTDWHYYALGNIGDSKKTDYSRVNDPADPKEFVVEIMDNTLPNSTFLDTEEALASLEADVFDEKGTYGFRYEMSGITSEQEAENIKIWKDFYKWVVKSTDEEFVAELGDWVILDSALYFYLFTERYTMIDNRAKNTFWHYAKCEDGKYRFDFWDYDNDTALGINNSGELTMTYGAEDTDYRTDGDPSSGYIFNAAESKFFCRIRDLMRTELQNMYLNRESQNCWSASSLINQFDEMQSQFPEEVWRLDIERKYLRTYRNGNTRFLIQMMQGRKKYQRRQFERDQEKYMATKYFGTTVTSEQIMFRCNTPTTAVVKPDYTLHLTPYSDMYLSVMFGATYRTQIRAKAGKQYDIECPFSTMDDTAVLIYCASRIQAISDLSACYIHDNDFSKASKLQILIIGNATNGYQNTFLTELNLGNNPLLKTLDIQNTPKLTKALDTSGCGNLEELYAYGSGLTGITFANGGKINIAQLPAINSLTAKNLAYLTELDITSYDNFDTLVVESCDTIDVQEFFNKAANLNRVRITGINWNLTSTDLLDSIYNMAGIDKNGYNISQSVLSGYVHVPVMREQRLNDFTAAWPDLEIGYDTLINQFAVTFVNYDDTVLDVQYVDKGGNAVDPITRTDNPISTPTRPSTVSTDFTYSNWDLGFTGIFANRKITAQYTESVRNYTVRFVSRGTVRQEYTAPYGSTVFYTKDIPTYTDEESAYVYYLFNGWDKFGYVDGDKTINAVFDRFEYHDGCFDGKDLSEMTPVEIYALIKTKKEQDYVQQKDTISFDMGSDLSYDNIEEKLLIANETVFTGKNYIDTGIKLLESDRDWTLAVDYKWGSENNSNAVLMQCYQGDGSNGFKLWQSTQLRITWGTSSTSSASSGNRDMLVLRHIKGDTQIHVYKGNLPASTIDYSTLSASRCTAASQTLVFGCSRADDGIYENYGSGTIYWAKLWYADLGDSACQELVGWTHENITVEMSGFRKYYLSDGSGARSSMTFLASQLLENQIALNGTTSNTGGWASTSLNTFLNTRFYNAIPIQYRQLIKQCKISSSAGDRSKDMVTSNCYIAIPSVNEIDASYNYEPYNYEGETIAWMTSDSERSKKASDGVYHSYWTRSPNADYSSYWFAVNGEPDNNYGSSAGSVSGFEYSMYEKYVDIMFSI